MKNIGRLYLDDEGHGPYVLLKTALGYIALDMITGNTFGGLQRTIKETTYGLQPTGYVLDIDKTNVSGRPFQED